MTDYVPVPGTVWRNGTIIRAEIYQGRWRRRPRYLFGELFRVWEDADYEVVDDEPNQPPRRGHQTSVYNGLAQCPIRIVTNEGFSR